MTNEDRQYNAERLEEGLATSSIPEHMKDAIRRYILRGYPPGDFLRCVFSNDLMGAAGRADYTNQYLLFEYCKLLYNYVPTSCYGSQEKVDQWVQHARETETES